MAPSPFLETVATGARGARSLGPGFQTSPSFFFFLNVTPFTKDSPRGRMRDLNNNGATQNKNVTRNVRLSPCMDIAPTFGSLATSSGDIVCRKGLIRPTSMASNGCNQHFNWICQLWGLVIVAFSDPEAAAKKKSSHFGLQ
ncbi:uncharacterized protein LOC118464193 [Anopheles albimanus]|uniref:uncharacterized protein LOC118464193 n=1 Tax=Anopheles albimanus TaxID=7167 RepID=UPI00163E98FB|nr:uncharacterized protein LOC118464193 [Anopheles albimanus]